MYTLEQLQSKTLGALRKIGDELNVLPAGDRRYRETWIEAIAGVNPPLLQLLEVSPAASVEQVQPIIETVETSADIELETPLESKFGRIVYPRPAQGAIEPAVKTSPGVEADRAQEAIESNSSRILYPRAARLIAAAAEAELIATATENPPGIKGKKAQESIKLGDWVKVTRKPRLASGVRRGEIFQVLRVNVDGVLVIENPHENPKYILSARLGYLNPSEVCLVPRSNRLDTPAFIDVVSRNFPDRLQELLQNPPGVEVELTQKPIAEAAKTFPGIDVDQVEKPLMETVAPSPSVEVDPFEPKCSECFDDGYIEDEFGRVAVCCCNNEPKLSRQKTKSAIAPAAKNLPDSRSKTSTAHQLLELFKSSAHIIENSPGVKTEATVSESAIEPAAKISINSESDLNPILTGIPLSDHFVARYSPPQPEIEFNVEADGQLTLIDFNVVGADEAPDPDDFESLDDFRQAIARWDWEHPNTFDHCSDLLPSSQDNDVSSQDKPLEVSLDSFCEWAPCPDEWYEPAALLEQSKVSELPLTCKSSITSDFLIPTFDRWGDRSDGGDEPPDTGIFARLPKPKPPNFPPQVGHKLDTSWTVSRAPRNCPETVPKLFQCIAAGTSTQPARSPPGGDAM